MKFFGTDGIRGKFSTYPMSIEFLMFFSNSLCKFLLNHKNKIKNRSIIISQDTRISCNAIKHALISGIMVTGINVIDVGIAPTPVLSFLVRKFNCDFGIMISASHNNYLDNGIKIFSSDGIKLSTDDEIEIESFIDNNNDIYYDLNNNYGFVSYKKSYLEKYENYCFSKFNSTINYNKKIVVDCSNGSCWPIVKNIFNYFNINAIYIGNCPDGKNINLDCGVLNTSFLYSKLLKNEADLGISFDGDGDRIVLLDKLGRVFNGDDILYLLSLYENIVGSSLGYVGTVMTNKYYEDAFAENKKEFYRSCVGDKNIIKELIKKKWYIGGESSGHIINLHYNHTGDGIMTALQILSILSFDSKALLKISSLPLLFQISKNVKLSINLIEKDLNSMFYDDFIFVKNRMRNKGRFIVRKSGTEPVIRIMVEHSCKLDAEYYCNYLLDKITVKIGIKNEK